MYLLYSILLGIGVFALLPRFLFDAARHGKYAAGLGERAGALPKFDAGGRAVVWLHCVSVGEAQAARPLVRALLEEYPHHALVVSTTTLTGQRVAREAFAGQAALVFYFPFDWAWSVRRALRRINPSAVLVMETELWPRFFRECRRAGVPVALVNGRISEKSFSRYRLIRPFIRRVLADLSLAAMQSEGDATRLCSLGLAPERARVTGNVKFDLEETTGQPLTEELRRRFRFDKDRPLVVAASTHAPEERIVLEAFKLAASEAFTAGTGAVAAAGMGAVAGEGAAAAGEDSAAGRPRLLIAPRHPERFAEVAAQIAESGLSWTRRSVEPRESDVACDVILLDSIGELRAVYMLAEVVFVGGSIAPVGGHNVLEPALAARPVITGAHTSNFKAIVGALLEREALVQLPPTKEPEAARALAHALRDLLNDDVKRRRTGERARAVLEQNRGATARTVKLLAPILEERSEVGGQRSVEEKALTSKL
ncbi:MAG: 3-deoxy-D-manno-octulosonic-acid transferase [Acidobacteriota bacterium]|jgi:3-deoxy-D-manno-octulosonic-acid transferase|nr:3-deoxy-D-manno-octulosonic-acid transferase [Acidobacteriota bacterium]